MRLLAPFRSQAIRQSQEDSSDSDMTSFLKYLHFIPFIPQMSRHVNMAVGLEVDALGL